MSVFHFRLRDTRRRRANRGCGSRPTFAGRGTPSCSSLSACAPPWVAAAGHRSGSERTGDIWRGEKQHNEGATTTEGRDGGHDDEV